MWHPKEPSLLNGHKCRAQVKICNGDISIWVKNSRVGRKNPNQQTHLRTLMLMYRWQTELYRRRVSGYGLCLILLRNVIMTSHWKHSVSLIPFDCLKQRWISQSKCSLQNNCIKIINKLDGDNSNMIKINMWTVLKFWWSLNKDLPFYAA